MSEFENDNAIQVAAALTRLDWIFPAVCEGILALNWGSAKLEAVTQYCDIALPETDRRIGKIRNGVPQVSEVIAELMQPGMLEARLGCLDSNDVPSRLLEYLSAYTGDPFLTAVIGPNASALLDAYRVMEDDKSVLHEMELANLVVTMLYDLHGLALEPSVLACASFLGLETIDVTITPAELVAAVDARIGQNRGINQSAFFAIFTRILNKTELPRHVLALVDCYFNRKTPWPISSDDLGSLAGLVERFRAFEVRISEEFSAKIAEAQLSILFDRWNTMLSRSVWSTKVLIDAGAADSEELKTKLWQLLDAVVGYTPGQPLDLQQIDYLIRHNKSNPLLGCLGPWLEALNQRHGLETFVLRITEDVRQVSDEEWWYAASPVGRTAIVAAVFFYFFESSQPEAAFEFLSECFGSESCLERIADITASAPDESARRTSICLVFFIILPLVQSGQFAAVVAVVERALKISYWSDDLAEQVSAAFSQATDTLISERGCYVLLAMSLVRQGHGLFGYIILEKILGGMPPDPNCDFRRLDATEFITPGIKQMVLGIVLLTSQYWGDLPALRPVLEKELGLPDLNSAANAELQDALQKYLADGLTNTRQVERVEMVGGLAEAIAQTAGGQAAIRVWECAFGIIGKPDEEIAACFREDETECWLLMAVFVADYLIPLGQADRYLAVAALLYSRNELGEPDWLRFNADTRKMQETNQWIAEDFRQIISHHVLVALRESGQKDLAIKCAEEHLANNSWTTQTEDVRASDGALYLACEVAGTLVNKSPEVVLDLQGHLMSLMTDVFGFSRTAHIERLWGANKSSSIRRTLTELGNSLAIALGQDWKRIRIRNLAYDAQLAQQTVMLRFLRGRPTATLANGPALQPGKPLNRVRTSKGAATVPVVRLDQSKGAGPAHAYGVVRREPVDYQPDESSPVWKEHTYEWDLAEALRPDQAVLRVGFALDGCLVWSLFRANGARLEVTANDGANGRTSDRERILAALATFDRQVDNAWDLHEVAAEHGSNNAWVSQLQVTMLAGEVFQPFTRQLHNRISLMLEYAPRVWKRFLAAFPEPTSDHETTTVELQVTWEDWWRETLDSFCSLSVPSFNLRSALDQATEQLLSLVEAVWSIDEICGSLRQTEELILWVEDALLGIPVPFLKSSEDAGSKYLFEHVESVRSIISPQLDTWMAANDQHAAQEPGDDRPLIASLSWFSEMTKGEQATEDLLNRLFARLSDRHGDCFEWRTAGGRASVRGEHDVLARGLAETGEIPFALLAVCGHGHDEPQGVQLGDGVWGGSEVWTPESDQQDGIRWRVRGACDLSRVDFLIQLSCSIGRLRQSGLQDVSGFCTELFLNRLRSVLAGRWPLNATESIQFAGWVSNSYLRRHTAARAASSSLFARRARGKSVAAARRHWAELYRRGKTTISLNTVAGLELYGLS